MKIELENRRHAGALSEFARPRFFGRKLSRRAALLPVLAMFCCLALDALALPARPPISTFAYEPTDGSAIWDVYNLSGVDNELSIYVYNSAGTLLTGYPKTVVLRPYEQKTFNPSNPENLATCGAGTGCGLDLPIVSDGRTYAAGTTAYGVDIKSTGAEFGVFGAFDNRISGVGSGNQTYTAQPELYTDTWWGMYNYPSSNIIKQDYFHIFNANDSATVVTLEVYDTDGNPIDANGAAAGTSIDISFNARETKKIFPQIDLNVAETQQDIGIHMSATNGVAIQVSTNLGNNYGYSDSPPAYTSYDNVGGGWVPQPTWELREEYYFTNTRNSSSLAAVRVTNPNASAITIYWDIFPYDGVGPDDCGLTPGTTPYVDNCYHTETVIPAYGTRELLLPPDPNSDLLSKENVADPWFHGNELKSADGSRFTAHVSYEENIDTPVRKLTTFWYGVKDPTRTKQWLLFNPTGFSVDITCDAWDYDSGTFNAFFDYTINGARGSMAPPGSSTTVTLGPWDALATNPADSTYGPVNGGAAFTGNKDKVVHCYSTSDSDGDGEPDPWTIELQEPDYGDVNPLRGGYYPPWFDRNTAPASLGNRVWLDEDGDGVQDAGEDGIPNLKVELYDVTGQLLLATTYTDADGGYVFKGLTPNIYTVKVTPVSGMHATYDENGIGTLNETKVNIDFGDEHETADFGYNWAPSTDTDNPASGAVGAIGDRVWIDSDGDGEQDPGEPGLAGVPVTIYYDHDGDGVYDEPYLLAKDADGNTITTGTTTTDENGNYIFDDLPAGSYVVEVNSGTDPSGYTQTGDPDQFGSTCTPAANCDNRTTSPIVLAPGDVFVNADFGYQPDAGTSGSISDTVWIDSDLDGNVDAGEPGIPNVTVSLIQDLDGDGTWDAGEPVIATDITDANGQYAFTGLPVTDGTGTDDYLVWVNDTESVIMEPLPVYDVYDGATQDNPTTGVVTGLEISAVSDLTTTPVTTADFAYAPAAHNAGDGLIGDTIYLDRNNDGSYDPGEGLEGVVVQLYSTVDDTLIFETTTDENGFYSFGGLYTGMGTNYRVEVVTSTLPGGGTGLTNTDDPDAGTANQSVLQLTAAAPFDYDQDFGYYPTATPNTISGTIWEDTDADGTLEGGETGRFEGITVWLRDSSGNIVGTTTTDASGNYSFTGLPDGTYTVDVVESANELAGYWKSDGPNAGADGNSQVDPYTVTVAGGQTNATADFGYYVEPASIGNYVWEDTDGDGIQDAGEFPIPGVEVKLTISYPNGDNITLVTTTDADGFYSFDNLLLDEDYNGQGANQPTYTLTVDTAQAALTDLVPSPVGQGGDAGLDSNDPTGTTATPIQGATDDTYDFGFMPAGSIGDRVWLDEDGDGIQDTGEAGVAGVTVQLRDSGGNLVAATVTDTNGNYVFDGLPPGDYTVTILPPAGMDPTYDENGGFDNTTVVSLPVGVEHSTADFGLNHVTPAATDTPALNETGAIGDRIWNDADGDGVQDPEEAGIAGVDVLLKVDSNNDGIYGGAGDAATVTVTTDENGNYVFPDLPPDAYVLQVDTSTLPAGFNTTPTGYPEGGIDNVSDPIVIGPGDVYVNGDFGYRDADSSLPDVSGTIYLDADADAVEEVGVVDMGIEGVTVGLAPAIHVEDGLIDLYPGGLTADDDGWVNGYQVINGQLDINGDGNITGDDDGYFQGIEVINGNLNMDGLNGATETSDDGSIAGDPVATAITDFNGDYLFPSVQPGDYAVVVIDIDVVTYRLAPTQDYDESGLCSVCDDTGYITVTDGGPDVTDVDFGYTPTGHAAGDGLIEGKLALDSINNQLVDDGEALEGITVYICEGTVSPCTLNDAIAYSVTNEAGLYVFGGLDPDGTYTVSYDPATLPAGVESRFDAAPGDNVEDGTTTIDLSADADGVVSNIDFGLEGTNSVSGTLWEDLDADGVKDGNETGIFAGIEIDLVDAFGKIVATTTTNANGEYEFDDVPNGTYTIHVHDDTNLLEGYWESTGSGTQTVVLTGNTSSTNNNFGYYVDPAAVGNFVWLDLNENGIQDAGEAGIPGVEVDLTIAYPTAAGTTTYVTVTTVTDANGEYSFGNLLLDEDYNGAGGTEPTYEISIDRTQAVIADYAASPIDATNDVEDSDDPAAEAAAPIQGATDNTNDFGFHLPSIRGIAWSDDNGDGIQNAGEAAIPGVTVELRDSNGTVVGTLQTANGTTDDFDGDGVVDPAGSYYFGGLMPGNYTVDFVTPASYDETQQDQGTDDALDSDYAPATGEVSVVVPAGVNVTDVDGGFIPLGSVSGTVYADTTNPGVLDDPGDTGMSNITLELYRDINGDGILDQNEIDAGPFRTTTTSDGTVDVDGDTIADPAGDYAFLDVPIGNYIVVEQDPAGFQSVKDESVIDGDQANTDGNNNQLPVTVSFNTDDGDNNFLDVVASTNAIDDDNNTLMDYPVSGDVRFNDFDPENDTQTLTGFQYDSDGDGVPDTAGAFVADHTDPGLTGVTVAGVDMDGNAVAVAGELKLETDGTYTFIPAKDFTGTVHVHYTLCDNAAYPSCESANLTITVEPWPDPQDASGSGGANSTDSVIANDDDEVSYGDAVGGNVVDNDEDPEHLAVNNDADPLNDTLDFQSFLDQGGSGAPISSGATLSGTDVYGNTVANAGSITFDPDGNYTFTPTAGFYGTVEVPYELQDQVGETATAVLAIDVINETDEFLGGTTEVNDPPFAGDDLTLAYYEGPGENQTFNGDWLGNDSDPNADSLTLNHAFGTPIATEEGGTITFAADGTYVYSPPTDYLGPDKLTYQVCDNGTPSKCDVATIYLVVLPVMDFGDLPEATTPGWDQVPAHAPAWGVKGPSAPRHTVIPKLGLGAIVDGETNGSPSLLTDGDDLLDSADEDSATFPAIGADDGDNVVEVELGETASYTISVRVRNDTGNDAALVGYVDWNCNGVLEEPGERARIIVDGDGTLTPAEEAAGECGYYPSAANRYCALTWGNVDGVGGPPLMTLAAKNNCGVVASQERTFARLRLTTEPDFFTDTSPSPDGKALDGEVEDYNLIVNAATTPAIITDVAAIQHVDKGAVVSWSTAAELGVVAFRVERLVDESKGHGGNWTRIHESAWIPSLMELQGSDYRVFDAEVAVGERHVYRIIEKSNSGGQLHYGPFEVDVSPGAATLNTEEGYEVLGRFDYDRVVENLETRAKAKGKLVTKDNNARDTLRMQVEHTGIHGLTTDELVAAFQSDTDQIANMLRRGQFRLTSRGQEIPWYEQDGVLYFYGQGTDNLFSRTRTYWLYMKQAGVTMPVTEVADAPQSSEVFIDTRDHEKDTQWWLSLTTDAEADYWIWNWVRTANTGRSRTFNLPVPGVVLGDGAVDGELKLRLWGADNVQHLLSVSTAAGVEIGEVPFAGNIEYPATLTIPAEAFDDETLDLVIRAEDIPGVDFHSVLIDGFEVTWQRKYVAEAEGTLEGSLKYPADGATSVAGFVTDELVTMDVFDPLAPVWVTGGDVSPANGGFAFSAELPLSEYATVEAGQALKPASMVLDDKSDLADDNNRADYVIITHAELMDAALALAEYRELNFRTMVIDIQDIYDEFTEGEPRPEAMNRFAKTTRSWKLAPSYFAILGDGSFDYRDIMSTAYNFVSPQVYGSSNGLFASDNLMGDVDDDGVPDVAFGRIPVKSVSEGMDYIAKLTAYEAGIGQLPSLLLADMPDKGGDFTYSTLLVEQEIESDTVSINLEDIPIGEARSALDDELDAGVRLINFLGHAGTVQIASQGVMRLVPKFANGVLTWEVHTDSALDNIVTPGFVGLSCLINNYSIPGFDGIGERMVTDPAAGLVVSWAATGESFNDQATSLGVEFHRIQADYERLGDAMIATFQAKPYLLPVYTLLGDPALLLQ